MVKETELPEETCSGLGDNDNLLEREQWLWDPGGISMGESQKLQVEYVGQWTIACAKRSETGESGACLIFCREARVTGAEQAGDWKEWGADVDSVRWSVINWRNQSWYE